MNLKLQKTFIRGTYAYFLYVRIGSPMDMYSDRVSVYFFSRHLGDLGIRICSNKFVRPFVCLSVRVHDHTKEECVYVKIIGRFLQIFA